MNQFNTVRNLFKKYWLMAILSLIVGSIIAFLFIKKQLQESPAEIPATTIELVLTDVYPKPPVFESAWSTELIKFIFDKPVDPKTIIYTVSPEENTRIVFKQEAPSSFSILPLSGWKENQPYTIIISKDLASRDGYKMAKDITITFTRTFPQNFVGVDESHEYPENR